MTGNRMVVHGVTGKRIVGCRLEYGPDGKMGVVIDMEDERPKLLTLDSIVVSATRCAVSPKIAASNAVILTRLDIQEKAKTIFVTGGSMARSSDPLGQRYIHYDDLLDLLKT